VPEPARDAERRVTAHVRSWLVARPSSCRRAAAKHAGAGRVTEEVTDVTADDVVVQRYARSRSAASIAPTIARNHVR
jgi:hypothetical protein